MEANTNLLAPRAKDARFSKDSPPVRARRLTLTGIPEAKHHFSKKSGKEVSRKTLKITGDEHDDVNYLQGGSSSTVFRFLNGPYVVLGLFGLAVYYSNNYA